MHELAPVSPFVALAYLIAGVLFILALRGLSSPATSRRGNRMGMIGMAIAVVTTLYTHDIASLPEIIGSPSGLVWSRFSPDSSLFFLTELGTKLVPAGAAKILAGTAEILAGAAEIPDRRGQHILLQK